MSLPHSDFCLFSCPFRNDFLIFLYFLISLAPKRPSRYDFGHFRTCRYFGLSGHGRPLEVSLRAGHVQKNGPRGQTDASICAKLFPGRRVRRSRALVPSFEPITDETPKNRPKKAAIFHEKGANWHGDRPAANTSETRRRREPFLAYN